MLLMIHANINTLFQLVSVIGIVLLTEHHNATIGVVPSPRKLKVSLPPMFYKRHTPPVLLKPLAHMITGS